MYQALYRKYRPRTFEDVVGQEHVTETLRRQVEAGRTSHAYIFVGTRGTGKTTCAKILSRALNCEHPVNGDPCNECASCRGIESGSILDVVEIDAASNNGVDNIRAIREEAVYTPAEVRRRVYIIDEVHMLSGSAFNALLKILEEPPEHLVFILATTELNKVPATILSRCQHFSFRRIMPENIEKRLQYVASREELELTPAAASLLARLADGSMRDALSLLDQCVSSGRVDEEDVIRAVGLMGAENTVKLWESLRSGDTGAALELFDRIYFGGAEPASVLNGLLGLARDMLITRLAPSGSRALLTGAYSAERLTRLCSGVDTGRLLAVSEAIQEAADALRDARDKRTRCELCLVKAAGMLEGSYRPASAYAPAPEDNTPAPLPAQPDPEGPPPWEDEDIPPEDYDPLPPEPVSEDIPAQPAPAPAAPKPEEPKPTENEPKPEDTGGDWWGGVLKKCAGTVDGGAYNFLSNRDNASPELEGARLTIHTRNGFVKMMLDRADTKNAVARAATELLGRAVTVTVDDRIPEKAQRPTQAEAESKLDKLARFDGIVKFK